MLNFERINLDSVDWERQLEEFPDRTVFQTRAWLSFVATTQHAEPVVAALKDGQQPVGYFIGLIVQKFRLRILGSPFPGWTTSYMGLCLKPSTSRRRAIEAV